MKKLFALFSCSNPGIKAGKKFLNNPTGKNSLKLTEVLERLSDDERKEYEEWEEENASRLKEAHEKAMEKSFDDLINTLKKI